MERWNTRSQRNECFPDIDLFLKEITIVCKNHGFSISHEDVGGAFMIKRFNNDDVEWLQYATVDIEEKQ
jgi:hypothetical protein